ncbi:hypothetical protein [Marinomonas sp. GJ51-6]|uniref:hypothetical protein n=1 Tax=Marinomonas sp. GJ51-6 TaxID=2992802 RepID=UPI00293431F2|nr:hypothetical protein [Marinomonas sp. GJ51-6]WOD08527.1 hypothetical protein ONZ50_05410 [Marinomonas sp. GJ51-6]
MHSIMIICPDHSPLKESEKWLSRYGFQVNSGTSLEQVDKYYEISEFDLLLVDQEIIDHLNSNEAELPKTPRHIILDASAQPKHRHI